MNGQDLAPLRRDMYQESLTTDSLAEHLEGPGRGDRGSARTPWPRRIAARALLGRQLRRSVRYFPGSSFADRRTAAATADWVVQR